MTDVASTAYDKIGEAGVRAVVTEFYARVFRDVMIGFMFAGKDRAHLIEREFEFSARMLGARDVAYRGQPIRTAHSRHTIFGGHFERRLQILREVMADLGVDPEVQGVWIEHTRALRGQVTRDKGSECSTPQPPKLVIAPPEPPATPPLVKLGRR